MKTKAWNLLVLLFIAIFVFSAVNNVHALSVTATIPVGNAPSGAAYDSAKGEIFVANGQDNTTSVISDSTNTVIATIPVGGYPYGVAYDSRLSEIFVVNLYSNTVSVISDSTNSVIATIPVGESPYNIAYDSSKDELFVTNQYDSTVSVISDSTNTVIATIRVGSEPFSIAYDSGKSEIFVVDLSTDTRNYSLSVISDSANTVVATVAIPGPPSFLAYDSEKNEIFVSTGVGLYGAVVTVISDSNYAVVATISNLNDEVQVEGLIYDPALGQVFVALHQNNEVAVISDSDNKVVQTITVGNSPWVGTYDPGNGAIYVANGAGGTVSVISGPSTSTSSGPTASNPPSSSTAGVTWIIIVIIIIVVLILILLLWYSRQRKLVITVQNSQTLSPILAANVSAEGPENLTGTTKDNGQIVFKNPKKGDYSIKANATGYKPSMPVSISVKNKTQYTVKLEPSASETQGNNSSTRMTKGDIASNSDNTTQQSQTPITQTQQQNSVPVAAQTARMESSQSSQQESSEEQVWSGERVRQNIKTFQEKGALSPETALTASELGLSRMFVRVMEKRKGQTKVFKEINGKYYLDQKALDEQKQ